MDYACTFCKSESHMLLGTKEGMKIGCISSLVLNDIVISLDNFYIRYTPFEAKDQDIQNYNFVRRHVWV